jgi:aspartate aminotransferase
VSTGAKQALFNALSVILNPGDEVVLLSPYWLSYPQMIKLWGAEYKIVEGKLINRFEPDLQQLEEAITDKTKAVILNSPNNPTGVHYSDEWMKGFADVLKKKENVLILSDEIYGELSYYDPKPTYFYQHEESLLERTLIFDGLSKSFAATGLRLGYVLGDKKIIKAMNKVQGQSTSGANSLIQRATL